MGNYGGWKKPTDLYRETCQHCGKSLFLQDFEGHSKSCKSSRDKYVYIFNDFESVEQNDFAIKLSQIRANLDKLKVFWTIGKIELQVERDSILEDSVNSLLMLNDQDMLKEFQIVFIGEVASDAGGLTKEWLSVLVEKFLTDEKEFFVEDIEENMYQVPTVFEPRYLMHYYVFGIVLAKALVEEIPVVCPMNSLFFKSLLNEKIEFEDLKTADPVLYNSLNYIRENTINSILFMNFTVERRVKGKILTMDLIPNGSNIEVSDENKLDYVKARIDLELSLSVPMKNIKQGFFSFIPEEIFSSLRSPELEKLLCGDRRLDIGEWEEFTEYSGVFSRNHEVIISFWKVLSEFSQDNLRGLLRFVTGANRVPINGFRSLKSSRGEMCRFTIVPICYYPNILPRGHTCFNRLDLPMYPNSDLLKDSLIFISTHSFSFGIE